MSITIRSARHSSEAKQRLTFALDVASLAEVEEFKALLKDEVRLFKVGKQSFLHGGPQGVRSIQQKGERVFFDLKFHNIPHTVANANGEAARLGMQSIVVGKQIRDAPAPCLGPRHVVQEMTRGLEMDQHSLLRPPCVRCRTPEFP